MLNNASLVNTLVYTSTSIGFIDSIEMRDPIVISRSVGRLFSMCVVSDILPAVILIR